jgi:hypothetical protein
MVMGDYLGIIILATCRNLCVAFGWVSGDFDPFYGGLGHGCERQFNLE